MNFYRAEIWLKQMEGSFTVLTLADYEAEAEAEHEPAREGMATTRLCIAWGLKSDWRAPSSSSSS